MHEQAKTSEASYAYNDGRGTERMKYSRLSYELCMSRVGKEVSDAYNDGRGQSVMNYSRLTLRDSRLGRLPLYNSDS